MKTRLRKIAKILLLPFKCLASLFILLVIFLVSGWKGVKAAIEDASR